MQANLLQQNSFSQISRLKSVLGNTLEKINLFQSIMSSASPEDRAKLEFPRQFNGAWLRIISALVSCSEISRPEIFTEAKALIYTGMGNLIKNISDTNLLDKAVVLPLEVVSLLALQLFQDQVKQGDNILKTYKTFLNSVVSEISYVYSRPCA